MAVNSNVRDRIIALQQSNKEKDDTIAKLTDENKSLQNSLMQMSAKCQELQDRYDELKISKAITNLSKGDIKSAKSLINRMINEIDVCIGKIQK